MGQLKCVGEDLALEGLLEEDREGAGEVEEAGRLCEFARGA